MVVCKIICSPETGREMSNVGRCWSIQEQQVESAGQG